jgi:hypothetical protein
MRGIYNYMLETNHVSGVYIVEATLQLKFMLNVMLFYVECFTLLQ